MSRVAVQDIEGRPLSPCSQEKAAKLVASGKAEWVSTEPPVIRLRRQVTIPSKEAPPNPLANRATLLHICCGPCATWTVPYLQSQGATVTGFWYNPNIHPFSEHERRREALESLASQLALPMIWEPGYEVVKFMRAICGHEAFRERCMICYRMRLERTAQVATTQGFDYFTTTLLISPYQDLEALQRIGQDIAERYGVAFYGENLRRGFAEHHRLAREYGLYEQRYCGCLYSEWEALDRSAETKNTKRLSR